MNKPSETCETRHWPLLAVNVRTGHVHTVVEPDKKPEIVLNAFKANAARKMRENKLWDYDHSLWQTKEVSDVSGLRKALKLR